MIPTETEERIVGKKKTIRKKMLVFEFFKRKHATAERGAGASAAGQAGTKQQ